MDLAQLYKLQPPKLSQSVHREECTQCFDNQVRVQYQRISIPVAIMILCVCRTVLLGSMSV